MWNFKIIKKIIHKKLNNDYKAKIHTYNLDYSEVKSPDIFNRILIIENVFDMRFICNLLDKKKYDLIKIYVDNITNDEIKKMSRYKTIIVSEELFFLLPLVDKRNIICFWHGLTSFKKISSLFFDNYTPPFSKVVIGYRDKKLFSKLFKIPESKIIELPSVVVKKTNDIQKQKKEILDLLKINNNIKKIYFFCFSFEERPEFKTNIFFDLEKLEKELHDDELIIFNIHPSLHKKELNHYQGKKIRFIKNISTTSLISISDVVITDYSSSVCEAIIMDKKIMFLMENFYSYDRGFIYKKKDMPGDVITSSNPKKIINSIRKTYLSNPNKSYIKAKENVIYDDNPKKKNKEFIMSELKDGKNNDQ